MARARQETTRDNATERREELLALAAEMFASLGFAHCSMRNLADRADMLAGSLYYHFASKDEIVRELISRYFVAIHRRYDEIEAATSDPLERLEQFILGSAEVSVAMADHATILHQDWHHLRSIMPDLEAQWRATESRWVAVIEAAGSAGRLRAGIDARMIYRTMIGSLSWLPLWFDSEGDLSTAQVAAGLREILTRGIEPAPDQAAAATPGTRSSRK